MSGRKRIGDPRGGIGENCPTVQKNALSPPNHGEKALPRTLFAQPFYLSRLVFLASLLAAALFVLPFFPFCFSLFEAVPRFVFSSLW